MWPLTPWLQCWPLLSLPCPMLAEEKEKQKGKKTRQKELLFTKLLKKIQHIDGESRGMVQETKVPEEAVLGLVSGVRPWDIPLVAWQLSFLILHSPLPWNSAFTSKKHVKLVLRLGKSFPIAARRHLLLFLFCELSKGTRRAQGQLLPWVPPCRWLMLVAQSLSVSGAINTPSSELLQIIPVPSTSKFFSYYVWRYWWDDPPKMHTSSAQVCVYAVYLHFPILSLKEQAWKTAFITYSEPLGGIFQLFNFFKINV